MWPERFDCAVCVTFDLDAESVWLAEDPVNAERPVVQSHGRFGAQAVVPYLLPLLDRHAIRATFFVPGMVAEQHPQVVRAIAGSGNELAAHGYLHQSPQVLSEAGEEQALRQTRSILERQGGAVAGYRAPSWELSPHSIEILQRNGFRYSSNMMDSLHPYVHPGTEVVELPVHWALDDAAHFWFGPESWEKTMAAPSGVLEIWQAELDGILDVGGLLVLTLHPQLIARPHRLRMLETWLAYLRRQATAWVATCIDVADHVHRTST